MQRIRCNTGNVADAHVREREYMAFTQLAFGYYAYDIKAGALKARDYKDATDLIVEIWDEDSIHT